MMKIKPSKLYVGTLKQINYIQGDHKIPGIFLNTSRYKNTVQINKTTQLNE